MTLTGALAAAETAAPVESLDVVARMLKERLGAAAVSFLITDFTGGSVVRLGAAGSVDTDETARRITLRGTLYGDVIRTQRPSVEDKGEGALMRIVAPVTNRGDAIGLLELFLPRSHRPWRDRAAAEGGTGAYDPAATVRISGRQRHEA